MSLKTNKAKGELVENFIRERYGLSKLSNNGDGLTENGTTVEIKSAELLVKEPLKFGFVHTRYGRFSIRPEAHGILPASSKYIFAVTLKGRVLFAVSLPKSEVGIIVEKHRNPVKRYFPLISEVITAGEARPGSIKFFNNGD